MTSSYILKQYLQNNFYSVSSLCRLFNLSQKELSGWVKNNIYPDFKTRFNCLRKLDTSELKEEITIKDKDGFEFTLFPKMSKKFQTAKGRQHYYQSDTFEELKSKVSKRSGNKCELCGVPGSGSDGRKGITCHHLVYDQDFGTGNENLDDLIDVCFYHHAMLHSIDNPEKAKAFKELNNGKYKILLMTRRDGSHNIKLLDDHCNNKDIITYYNKIMKSVKKEFRPKYEILEF